MKDKFLTAVMIIPLLVFGVVAIGQEQSLLLPDTQDLVKDPEEGWMLCFKNTEGGTVCFTGLNPDNSCPGMIYTREDLPKKVF